MKNRAAAIILCITLLAACTPTPTATGVSEIPPSDSPAAIATLTPTPTTSAPIPEGETIIVTSVSDSGPGSLRQALMDAQSYDTITFDPAVFSPDAPAVIYVTSELPHIRIRNLTLDASNAGVILNGSQVPGGWTAGLQLVSSESSTIMGLQISYFPGPGIAISGDSTYNIIGGDRSLGVGPFGQGNLFSQNKVGVDLSSSGPVFNTVTGNLIGTDAGGAEDPDFQGGGVHIWEGAHGNIIGPDNIIAYNRYYGIAVEHSEGLYNTITQNSIYENGDSDIYLGGEVSSNARLATPIILDYDLSAGTLTGTTCSNCRVEIFSDSGYGGEIFEGQTTADDLGVFTFDKGEAFSGPNLTVTTTNLEGTSSEFSLPTWGTDGSLLLQLENNLPITQILALPSRELADNRIGAQFDSFGYQESYDLKTVYPQGLTRARVAIAGLEPELVDWDKPEFSIDPSHDDVITRMAENGLTITYVMTFWDKETYPGGEGAPCARFQTEGEIERYLEFVRFIVDHFKDRVEYFEIWNEPEIRDYCPKWIRFNDYINLVKRTVPVIREINPEAKIVVGGVSNTRFGSIDYLFALVESDIMPLVDGISWHPMYGTAPEYDVYADYYYDYPAIVQRIKDTAEANGFVGEYQADELTWRTTNTAIPDQPWVFSPITASKYFGRGALMHRGMDVGVGIGSDYMITPNLCTVMAGVEPVDLPIEIQSTATNIVSYTFTTPDGGYMVALWTNGIAVENDPGVEAILNIPDFSASEVIVKDILYGFEQELIFETESGGLKIPNLLVRDYPILIQLIDASP